MHDGSVLIVEDDAHLRDALAGTLTGENFQVLTAENGESALRVLQSEKVGLVLSDVQMAPMDGFKLVEHIRAEYPSLPAILMTAHGTIENAVAGMRCGAADYLVKPFQADTLTEVVGKYLKAPADDLTSPICEDPASQKLFNVAERVAATDATVMITGESGCGKEVLARFIHAHSSRKKSAFIAINCAAIPENMLEAVLFGHEKGAFTGAANAHPGKFEQANGGTLLLDEISEMDLQLQAKLLRVIQEKEVERIGGQKTIALDVRVLATSNRDLRKSVAEGRFREDLYYRLNVFPICIPPLRRRALDIVPLANRFLTKYSNDPQTGIRFTEAACKVLSSYRWAGNVRELENLVQRTLILLGSENIDVDDLAFEEPPTASPDIGETSSADLQQGLKNHEFQIIVDAMETHRGKRTLVAESLGISPRTLRYKLATMREANIAIPHEAGADA